jgi:hypothetical protein
VYGKELTPAIQKELTQWYKKNFPKEYKYFQSRNKPKEGMPFEHYKSFADYIKSENLWMDLLKTKRVMDAGYDSIIIKNEIIVYDKT